MDNNLQAFMLLAFFLPIGIMKFSDYSPIKFDVIKVRTVEEMEKLKPRHTALDFIGLVNNYPGYSAEEHHLTTYDGYHLKIHRISGSPLSPKAFGKPVVFLQHGITMSSDAFIIVGPNHGIAYLLADAGYDVWLGNARGNTYCRSHERFSPDQKEFWDFSWHEIATIDLPTSIDYILSLTNQEQLTYVGHSMGTTMSYVLLSKFPQYNEKMRLVISMAPIAFWEEPLKTVFKLASDNYEFLKKFSERNEVYEFSPQSEFVVNLAKIFCSNMNTPTQNRPCAVLLDSIFPMTDFSRVSRTFSFPRVFNYIFAGASVKTVFHFLQNTISKKFSEYDYGAEINQLRYFQSSPPSYNLSLVTAPVVLIYGVKDYFVSQKNTEALRRKLPNVILSHQITYDKFRHIDFLLADDAKKLVYDFILSLIRDFNLFPVQYQPYYYIE